MSIFLTPKEELALLELLTKADANGFLNKEVSAATAVRARRLKVVLARKNKKERG